MIIVKTPFDTPFLFTLTSTVLLQSFPSCFTPNLQSRITMAKTFSQSDVAAHKKPDDLWIIVDEDVYDMTKFQSEHPGKLTVDYEPLLQKTDLIQGARKVSRPRPFV